MTEGTSQEKPCERAVQAEGTASARALGQEALAECKGQKKSGVADAKWAREQVL